MEEDKKKKMNGLNEFYGRIEINRLALKLNRRLKSLQKEIGRQRMREKGKVKSEDRRIEKQPAGKTD